MAKREMVFLTRDCMAMMVPSGARIMLHEDTEVTITQSLGDSFTVTVYGNLMRIEGKDADALGKQCKNVLDDMPEDASLEDKIQAQLKTVFDPEIPINIVDLGLIYKCAQTADENNKTKVHILMTLTAPGCGMGPVLAEDVKRKIEMIPEVSVAEVEIGFDPPWDRSMMSDLAKLELGLFE